MKIVKKAKIESAGCKCGDTCVSAGCKCGDTCISAVCKCGDSC